MPPPPAEPFAARIFLGPALRAQPDRRLVKLVREGYETAFEEIVRRYRKPLDRFAAAIVGGRSEDVTQDAFSKALLALRGTTTEIELKPWLYRIVRNTALNDLRDGPPPAEELGEAIAGGRSAAVEAERREEIAELINGLRALPEPQRAAIVMRELEGLSHEEIAAALGVSGGAARQAIYRARLTLRDGLGMLVPLPLLRMLFEHGTEAAGAGAGAAAAAGAASAAGGGGTALGGIGAAGALKVGLATAVLAGSVGAGVAMQHERGGRGPEPAEAAAVRQPASSGSALLADDSTGGPGLDSGRSTGSGEDRGHGGRGSDDGKGRSQGDDDRHGHDDDSDHSPQSGPGPGPDDPSGHGGRGSGHGGRADGGDDFGEDVSGGSHSGRHGSGGGPGSGGSGGSGSGSGRSGGGQGGSGSSDGGGSGDGGSGSDDRSGGGLGGGSGSSSGRNPAPAPLTSPPPTSEPVPEGPSDGSGESGSGRGDSGSEGEGSGGGSGDS
jgi:RNA polymerase sigma factor (sigma-70 family)